MSLLLRKMALQPYEVVENGRTVKYFYIPECRILARNGLLPGLEAPVLEQQAIRLACFKLDEAQDETLDDFILEIQACYQNLINQQIPLPPNVDIDAMDSWINKNQAGVVFLEPIEIGLQLNYVPSKLEVNLPKIAFWCSIFVTLCGLAMALNGLTISSAVVTVIGVFVSDQGMFGSVAKSIANDLDRLFSGHYKASVGNFSFTYALRSMGNVIISMLFSLNSAKEIFGKLIETLGNAVKYRSMAFATSVLTGAAIFVCTFYEMCDHFGWGFRDTRANFERENMEQTAEQAMDSPAVSREQPSLFSPAIGSGMTGLFVNEFGQQSVEQSIDNQPNHVVCP